MKNLIKLIFLKALLLNASIAFSAGEGASNGEILVNKKLNKSLLM